MTAKIHRLETGYIPERSDKIKELLEGMEKEIGKSLRLIGDATWIISGLYLNLKDITEFRKGKYVDILGQKR